MHLCILFVYLKEVARINAVGKLCRNRMQDILQLGEFRNSTLHIENPILV